MKVITINTVFIFSIYNAENIIPPLPHPDYYYY